MVRLMSLGRRFNTMRVPRTCPLGSAACGDAEWPEASCEYLVEWSQSACCAARSCGRDWEELWLGARFTRLTGEARECAVKVLEVPRAPHFVDKLAGRASEMQRVREQAEAHNRAARAHNRERMRLLA